jgi:hypothetical protein
MVTTTTASGTSRLMRLPKNVFALNRPVAICPQNR